MEKEGKPSIGINMPYPLRRVLGILKGRALVNGNAEIRQKMDDFNELINLNWNDYISR